MIGEYLLPAPDRKTWVLTVKHMCGRITKIYVVLRTLVRSFVYFHQLILAKTSYSGGFVRGNRRIAHNIIEWIIWPRMVDPYRQCPAAWRAQEEGTRMAESDTILQLGIDAAREGNRDEARNLFSLLTRQEPNNLSAWLWLAGVAGNPDERRVALERVLELDPYQRHGGQGSPEYGRLYDARDPSRPRAGLPPARRPRRQSLPRPRAR